MGCSGTDAVEGKESGIRESEGIHSSVVAASLYSGVVFGRTNDMKNGRGKYSRAS